MAFGTVAQAGAPLNAARLAVVMVHGRGGSAIDILSLGSYLRLADVAFLAPEADGHSWWPQSFLAPLAANEPGLSSGLAEVQSLVDGIVAETDLTRRNIALLGFSQGACLTLEAAARFGTGLRTVIALSGGLVGSEEASEPARPDLYGFAPKRFDYATDLSGTSVYIGCHESDPHIPLARVRESTAVLQGLGARVSEVIHPGAGHGITEIDVAHVARSLAA